MKMVCKFRCQGIQNLHSQVTVTLGPVYGDSPENKSFWEATPSGHIQLNITNPKAFDVFENGKEYYVSFNETNS